MGWDSMGTTSVKVGGERGLGDEIGRKKGKWTWSTRQRGCLLQVKDLDRDRVVLR